MPGTNHGDPTATDTPYAIHGSVRRIDPIKQDENDNYEPKTRVSWTRMAIQLGLNAPEKKGLVDTCVISYSSTAYVCFRLLFTP